MLHVTPRPGRAYASRPLQGCSRNVGRQPGRARCTGETNNDVSTVGTAAESVQQPAPPEVDEVVMFEGSGSKAELVLSLLLGATLIYLPLTLASIGRAVWSKHTFTNKRMIVSINSPIRKDTTEIAYSRLKEVRSVNRGLGLWGDMVFFLKDGSRLELVGIDDHQAIKAFVDGEIN